MPVYRSHQIFEIIKGIKAFLKLDVGVSRGDISHLGEQQSRSAQVKLRQAHGRIEKQSQQVTQLRELVSKKNEQLKQLNERPSGKSGGSGDDQKVLSYETIYDSHIQKRSADVAIGAESFDLIGRLELEVLKREGLKPDDSLLDLGCGTGRLAVNVIPTLKDGHYIGVDIAQTMLTEAQERIQSRVPDPPCDISWIHQTSPVFELEDDSVDMICAFSVINHMEHEDSYAYFKEALRVVRPGGHFVYSCLPLDSERGEKVFLKAAEVDLQTRYKTVRHVATSKDFMDKISRLAGWEPIRWYDGDEPSIKLPDVEELRKFGQTICVLEAPGNNGART